MANLNGRMSCIKYVLFSANFIFVLLGALVIAVGSFILIMYNNFETFLELRHSQPAQIMIAGGIIIFVVSFIGCIGAIKQSTLLVKAYAIMLFLLIIIEICAGITGFVMRYTIFDEIKENMEEALKDYTTSDTAQQAWDYTQKHMDCCGVEYPHDWAPENVDGHLVSIAGEVFTVPYSCCNNNPKFCADIYREGCVKSLEDYVSSYSAAIGYVAITVSVIQLVGVIIAVVLIKAIRRVKTEQEINMNSELEQRQGLSQD